MRRCGVGCSLRAVRRLRSSSASIGTRTKLLQTKEAQDAFERVGTYVVSTNPKTFGEYIEVEFKKWGEVVRAVNLKIN